MRKARHRLCCFVLAGLHVIAFAFSSGAHATEGDIGDLLQRLSDNGITFANETLPLKIKLVRQGSPAARAGIRSGDYIAEASIKQNSKISVQIVRKKYVYHTEIIAAKSHAQSVAAKSDLQQSDFGLLVAPTVGKNIAVRAALSTHQVQLLGLRSGLEGRSKQDEWKEWLNKIQTGALKKTVDAARTESGEEPVAVKRFTRGRGEGTEPQGALTRKDAARTESGEEPVAAGKRLQDIRWQFDVKIHFAESKIEVVEYSPGQQSAQTATLRSSLENIQDVLLHPPLAAQSLGTMTVRVIFTLTQK